MTTPLVGNYGVPDVDEVDGHGLLKHVESRRPWIAGLVVNKYEDAYSHYAATRSLGAWLRAHRIPALSGVDTRRLTLELRECGTMKGHLMHSLTGRASIPPVPKTSSCHLVSEVSTTVCYTVGTGDVHVCLVDCGTKINIIRLLVECGCKVTVVPYDYRFQDGKFDGVLVSNGPGDPSRCPETIANIREHIEGVSPAPLFGICLGHQLLALAAGAKIQKMKYGNRGYNQPVYFESTGKTYMTSQNHGYAVLESTINNPWRQSCWNKNDGSNEGMKHRSLPFQSVQFHPEARGGPHDTAFMFKDFYKNCQNRKYGVVKKNKVLLLGSGGLSIGQAGEFDYSGSQAIKAFKALGCEVCLINPNIATNQTRPGLPILCTSFPWSRM